MNRKTSKDFNKQNRLSEVREIELLNSWIQSQKPDSGSNPLSLPSLPLNAPVGDLGGGLYSRYAGATRFDQLPISKKVKDGLRKSNYIEMTDIQRASLPHALCGRDILGAAKTGSGKTLAFVIPVLEKLYKERWGPQDGVGSIIISPTRELAVQLFEVLKNIGKHHNFSAGLLIGGRKDVNTEKERVNDLNILVCTPGRLLQHMDETPNFDCSQLQVLVLDEADRILDVGFKKALNAIISQLPKHRQTMLFSATQTKSIQDLARLSLKDPEYLSVHKDALTATPNLLQQTAMIVPLEQKLDMLWSFIKSHLNSKILVFLSSCKQVKFVFEAFKKLRPGIPLKCLHGKMRQERRIGIYSEFCEQRAVLFSTDVVSRGLDFDKAVDWVVQVDCPDNVDSYIHRVGRTARYQSKGRSVLFLIPSEMKMLVKLQEEKVPVNFVKANLNRLQPVSGLLSALLVKYPEMQQLAQRAFITYLRSINMQSDKEFFDITKMPIDEFSASLGLPMTPKVRFLNQKIKRTKASGKPDVESSDKDMNANIPKEKLDIGDLDEEIVNKLPRSTDNIPKDMVDKAGQVEDVMPATRVSKKKKLKINIHRPVGSRVVFDDDGNTLPPLARIADINAGGDVALDKDKKNEYYKKRRAEMKQADKEDKLVEQDRLREKRIKKKMKEKEKKEEDLHSESDKNEDTRGDRPHKRQKKYFDSESEGDEKKENKNSPDFAADAISLAAQEELALKLLSSMHK